MSHGRLRQSTVGQLDSRLGYVAWVAAQARATTRDRRAAGEVYEEQSWERGRQIFSL
jgi:hypothetical protein